MTDQQTIDQSIIGKRIVAISWLPDISLEAPFEPLEGTIELQSITLEGGTKLVLSAADGREEVIAEIEEGTDKGCRQYRVNARCICPLCNQGHDPHLIGDSGEGKDEHHHEDGRLSPPAGREVLKGDGEDEGSRHWDNHSHWNCHRRSNQLGVESFNPVGGLAWASWLALCHLARPHHRGLLSTVLGENGMPTLSDAVANPPHVHVICCPHCFWETKRAECNSDCCRSPEESRIPPGSPLASVYDCQHCGKRFYASLGITEVMEYANT